jgi:hypothetical protein
MKKPFIVIMLICMLTVVAGTEGSVQAKGPCINSSIINLKYPMQKLWIEHAWWTREYIVTTLAGLKDQDAVLARLLQNQVDLGDIIKPYYGEDAGKKLTALLKEHILIAGKIVDAAKKGDKTAVDQFDKDWHRNADDIVAFLSSANPYWSKKVLTEMFYKHLKLTSDEVVYRLHGNWAEDIITADKNETHLIHMGDFLTDGIVKQFPKKFK